MGTENEFGLDGKANEEETPASRRATQPGIGRLRSTTLGGQIMPSTSGQCNLLKIVQHREKGILDRQRDTETPPHVKMNSIVGLKSTETSSSVAEYSR